MTNFNSAPSILPSNWIKKIDRADKKIVVYKAFLVASGEYGSVAFELKMELLTKYPGFDFIQYKPTKVKNDEVYSNPKYEDMKSFIKGYEPTEEAYNKVITELNDLRALLKGKKGAYIKVKEWFLDKYADEFARRKQEEADKKREKLESTFLYHPTTHN